MPTDTLADRIGDAFLEAAGDATNIAATMKSCNADALVAEVAAMERDVRFLARLMRFAEREYLYSITGFHPDSERGELIRVLARYGFVEIVEYAATRVVARRTP